MQSYFEELLKPHTEYVKNKVRPFHDVACLHYFGNFNKIITICNSELLLRHNLNSLKHLFRCYAILSFVLNEIYEVLHDASIQNIL